jgi:hypothetical protein
MRFKPKYLKEMQMNKSLKAAAAVAATTLGIIVAAPALAFPTSAIEFSRQTYLPYTPATQSTAQDQRIHAPAASSAFPSSAIEFSRQAYAPNARPAQSVAEQTPRVQMATATISTFPSAAKQD